MMKKKFASLSSIIDEYNAGKNAIATALVKAQAALRALPDSRLSNRTGDGERCLLVLSMNFETGTMKVRYDSMKVGTKNLVDALAKAGFEAEEIRGDAR